MKHLALVVTCSLLPVMGLAQSRAAADPLTGTWTGSMGPSGEESQPITVELKFDGKTVRGLITGPPYPGDITAGTLDRRTGALTFTVVVRDAAKTVVRFTGALKQGSAGGRFIMNDREGVFRISRKDPAEQPTASATTGQTTVPLTPEQNAAALEQHKADFDYLLGDWEFTAHSHEYPNFRGYWSAVRLDEGQILDEYRIVGDKGETYYVTTTLRNYNAALERWELVGADSGAGLQDFGTGRRVGSEMHIEQRFGVSGGKPSTWKIRYFNITPEHFSWSADRSTDGGKTWVKDYQTIDARRIGPARSLGALAGPKKGGSD